MPGSSRFKGDIFNTINRIFSKTELHTFENHLTFPDVAPFIEYVRASLSEDRRLWTSMFNGKDRGIGCFLDDVIEHLFILGQGTGDEELSAGFDDAVCLTKGKAQV